VGDDDITGLLDALEMGSALTASADDGQAQFVTFVLGVEDVATKLAEHGSPSGGFKK
jgi:hypothetical protein